MANRTDPDADTVHGANPQFLVDRIVRVKIYNDAYWKEYCFGLTTESLIDEAAKLDYVAGTYGGRRRPSRFLCLFLKLLQIQPDEDVVLEYIKQPELKYLRALGCAYLRITARYLTVYQTLEPLFADYRKLRYRNMQGKMSMIRMDEFIDWLMREETICDVGNPEVTMPQMPKREILEQTGQLDVYQSVLEDDLEDLEELERSLKEQAKEEAPAAEKAEASMPKEAEDGEGEKGEVEEKRREERRDDRRDDRRDRRDERERRDRRDGRDDDDRKERRERRDDEKKRKDRDDHRDREERREKKEKKDKKEKDEKKKKPKYANKADEERAAGHSKNDKDGLTVEESNEIRKRLGLKPLRFERHLFHATWGLEDRREGFQAFIEKRAAKWKDC